MDWLIVGLVTLVAFLAGGVFFLALVIRVTWLRAETGRPIMVTVPGTRPGESTTYAVDPRGVWHRLSRKPGETFMNYKALRALGRRIGS